MMDILRMYLKAFTRNIYRISNFIFFIIGMCAALLHRGLDIPSLIFLALAYFVLFWAGFQIYSDQISQRHSLKDEFQKRLKNLKDDWNSEICQKNRDLKKIGQNLQGVIELIYEFRPSLYGKVNHEIIDEINKIYTELKRIARDSGGSVDYIESHIISPGTDLYGDLERLSVLFPVK